MTDKKTDNTESTMSGVDIGGLLADKRSSNGVAVKTVAKVVKLSPEIIENLEANRFSDVGAPVYVRGYLGLYAKYLGLDATHIIHLYETQNPAQHIAIKPSVAHMMNAPQHKRKRHSKVLSFVIAVLFFSGLLYGYTKIEPLLFSKKTEVESVEVSDSPSSPVEQVITEAEGAQNLADDALNGLPINSQSSTLVSDLDLNLSLDEDLSADSNTATTGSAEVIDDATNAQAATQTENSESIISSLSETTVATDNAITSTTEQATLTITFSADCWLKITDSDGKVLTSNTYTKRRTLNVSGKPPLLLRTARLGAIRSATFNGQAIKLAQYRVSSGRYEIK